MNPVMEKYRKSDQYYIDEYDRRTIERLKELEHLMDQANKVCKVDMDNPNSEYNNIHYKVYEMQYLDTGVHFARNKEATVQSSIREDERKDRLIQSTLIPTNVRCNICFEPMRFDISDFMGKNSELIFIFSCANKHFPKKAVYPDGREYHIPKSSCSYCGGRLITKQKKTKNRLTLTDICKQCDKIEVLELDLSPEKILPINEDERKKYCTDFIGRRDFYEDLKAITDWIESVGVEKEIDYSQVKQLNIAQLEQVLSEQIEKANFIKVQFDKPKISRYLIVEFSAQDPTDRTEVKSIKALKKVIETALFSTNWRLVSSAISYNLGFLNGQLKGFSMKEDLIKLAREIRAKKPK